MSSCYVIVYFGDTWQAQHVMCTCVFGCGAYTLKDKNLTAHNPITIVYIVGPDSAANGLLIDQQKTTCEVCAYRLIAMATTATC